MDVNVEPCVDARYVTWRLEEAGATLLALPGTGWSTRLRTSSLEIVRTAIESYGWTEQRVRPPVPPAADITRMDEAMAWISLIPVDRYVLRRIVGARSLVHPVTERHLFPWRRLGVALGADHKAVQRWHAEGIGIIVSALNGATPVREGRARAVPRSLTRADHFEGPCNRMAGPPRETRNQTAAARTD
jgi:hypothetical protein